MSIDYKKCPSCKRKTNSKDAYISFRDSSKYVKSCKYCRTNVRNVHKRNRKKYNSKYFDKYRKKKSNLNNILISFISKLDDNAIKKLLSETDENIDKIEIMTLLGRV